MSKFECCGKCKHWLGDLTSENGILERGWCMLLPPHLKARRIVGEKYLSNSGIITSALSCCNLYEEAIEEPEE